MTMRQQGGRTRSYAAMAMLAAVLAAVLVLGSCAAPPPKRSALDHPSRVLVGEFKADPATVELDTTVRRGSYGTGPAADAARDDDIAAAQETLVNTLVYRVQQMGLTAQPLTPQDPAGPNDLVLVGQIDQISEGDRTQRASGSGHPVMTGKLSVTGAGENGSTTTFASFDANSQTGATPGLPGAEAAAAIALGSGGERARQLLRASVTAEARRLANIFADQLRDFFRQKGVIPPSG